MSKISLSEELNIIAGRALGQTYERLKETTGHGNSTISRVLQPENLCKHVLALYAMADDSKNDADFYKKWLHRTLIVWGVVTLLSLVLTFIF